MKNVDSMTQEVVRWISTMIPDRDPMNTAIKLAEEVSELQHSIYVNDGDAGQELADILILLVDVSFLLGVDLADEFNKKMEVNRKREWNREKGCLKHEQQ